MEKETQYIDLFPTIGQIFEDLFDNTYKINKKFIPSDNQTFPKYNIISHKASEDKNSQEIDNLEIMIAVPGYKKEDLKITMKDNVVEITGSEICKLEKGYSYLCKGFSTKSFKQSFLIPEDYILNKEFTKLEDGILHIVFKLNKKESKEYLIEIK